jgi:endonuclease III
MYRIHGIGDKIRDVLRNVLRGEPQVAVDTHTQKLFNRLIVGKKSISAIRSILNTFLIEDIKKFAHIIMVRLNKNSPISGRKPNSEYLS